VAEGQNGAGPERPVPSRFGAKGKTGNGLTECAGIHARKEELKGIKAL